MDMKDKEYKYMARKVAKLMKDFTDWNPVATSRHAEKLYGRQRSYRRVFNPEEDAEDDI